MGHNILPLLGHHNHDRFEIFCYAELPKDDDITAIFHGYADHWRTVNDIPNAEVAEMIRDDGIHIMVFLGGLFDKNRPTVAVHRPAPIQAGMFGGTTSALDEMDYWITDTILNPPDSQKEERELFTEEPFHLPSLFTYPKLEDTPDIAPLPADDNGFITFASFNKPGKINVTVLDLWSKLLKAVPDSRLMLKFKDYYGIPSISHRFLARFESQGVSPDRISMISADDSPQDHLSHYGETDIALDTFPFSGATTTFQALWMGVPVISLLGERFIGRMGGSLSTQAGLEDLVADNPDEYVEKAVALANDLPRLRELRAGMRQRISSSSLCDGPGFAANMENAFQTMWDRHISGD